MPNETWPTIPPVKAARGFQQTPEHNMCSSTLPSGAPGFIYVFLVKPVRTGLTLFELPHLEVRTGLCVNLTHFSITVKMPLGVDPPWRRRSTQWTVVSLNQTSH